jgi:hypothetical protein
MIFFLIVPVWLMLVCASGILLFFKVTRWLSAYLIVSSTLSVITSFVASLAGVVVFSTIGNEFGAKDFTGLFALGGYGVGLLVGGLFGAASGVLIVFIFHRRSRKNRLVTERD